MPPNVSYRTTDLFDAPLVLDRGGGGWKNVRHRDFGSGGAVGDGTADDRAAFSDADTDPSADGLLVPKGTFLIGSDLVISGAIQLAPGAVLRPLANVTLTLAGPVLAGPWRVFDLSAGGKVVLRSATKTLIPQWWGARGDGASDDTAAIQAMAAAADQLLIDHGGYQVRGGVNIHFPAGEYRVRDTIRFANYARDTEYRVSITGDGWGNTRIQGNRSWVDDQPEFPLFEVKTTGGNIRNWKLAGLHLMGGTYLLDTFGMAYATIEDCLFTDWTQNAIRTNSTGLFIIRGNYFWYGQHGSYAVQVGSNHVTVKSLIQGNYFGEEVPWGITAAPGSSNVTVNDNMFVPPGGSGRRLFLTGGCEGWIITGNQFGGADRQDAIWLDSGRHHIFSSNVVRGGMTCAFTRQSQIRGNVFSTKLSKPVLFNYGTSGLIFSENHLEAGSVQDESEVGNLHSNNHFAGGKG